MPNKFRVFGPATSNAIDLCASAATKSKSIQTRKPPKPDYRESEKRIDGLIAACVIPLTPSIRGEQGKLKLWPSLP
jgi:hypothetical protein